jgi:predicted acyl esterase
MNLRTRQDLIYVDYLDKLTPKELEWLNKFNGEYVNASFNEDPKKNLHKKKAQRKDCYDRNNSRNRCEWTRQKAQGKNEYLEEHRETLSDNPEDEVIAKIDYQAEGYLDDDGYVIKRFNS